uniref:Uncharacterized protein n=1 Tax=Oryza punctata TaxID=4537 RepID=A0A0E0JSW4_ORYPU
MKATYLNSKPGCSSAELVRLVSLAAGAAVVVVVVVTVPFAQLDKSVVADHPPPADEKKKINTAAAETPRRNDTSWLSPFCWPPIMAATAKKQSKGFKEREKWAHQ